MAIVIFLHVMIAIALVNTLSIEFIFSSAPTVCICGWSPSRLFPQMGNITVPRWMVAGRTTLIIKDVSKGNLVSNFRPITSLP